MKKQRNESMFNLIQRCQELRKKEEKKALDLEKSKQKELQKLLQEEKSLQAEVEIDKKAIEKLEQKASLDEPDPEIRKLRTELIRKELKICELRENIFHFLTYPGKLLADRYKELAKFVEYEIVQILEESGGQFHYEKNQIKHKLSLAEKAKSGMSSGFRWENLSKEEARLLIHDPIFPEKEIPSLLEQLSEIPDGEKVTVGYHQKGFFYPGLPVEVHQVFGESRVVKSNIKSEG